MIRNKEVYSKKEENDILGNINIVINLIVAESVPNGNSPIYPNQIKIGVDIVKSFNKNINIFTMVVSKTQSGKTGCMCAFIWKYIETNIIPIENIYIITGHSSLEWENQTKTRIPSRFHKNIFHRNKLINGFSKDIKTKKNVLIIMDEIQIASEEDQTITKAFNKAGFLNKKELFERDIKIVEFTATPKSTLDDLISWEDERTILFGDPGPGYISAYDLKNQGRVKQFKELYSSKKEDNLQIDKNMLELKTDIENFSKSKYHIIRTNNGIEYESTIKSFKLYFKEKKYEYKTFIKEGKKDEELNINNILQNSPKKHTFIFIKERLRCAITLNKDFLGVLYERYTKNPDNTIIIQGLMGRITGYYNVEELPICYTNITSIDEYEELWNSSFQKEERIITSKMTFNHMDNYETNPDKKGYSKKMIDAIFTVFDSFEDASVYIKAYMKKNGKRGGPRKRIPIEEGPKRGFYESTLGKDIKNKTKIRTIDEIRVFRNWNLNDRHYYTCYPAYENTMDKKTLKWCVSHL